MKRIVTDLAVLDVTDKGFKLLERAPGVSIEQIKAATEGTLIIEGDIPEINFKTRYLSLKLNNLTT